MNFFGSLDALKKIAEVKAAAAPLVKVTMEKPATLRSAPAYDADIVKQLFVDELKFMQGSNTDIVSSNVQGVLAGKVTSTNHSALTELCGFSPAQVV